MAFHTTLFRLLNANTTKIVVDGYEIETVQDCGVDASGAPVLRCECDDDNDWYFADQDVVVNDEGRCAALTAMGDWGAGDEPLEATLEFLVARPITAADL